MTNEPPNAAEGLHEALGGLVAAVASTAAAPGPRQVKPGGPLVVGNPAQARSVLLDLETFTVPFNVRRGVRGSDAITPLRPAQPLPPSMVAAGSKVFAAELAASWSAATAAGVLDPVDVLRVPVARAATAALMPDLSDQARHEVAARTLAWLDALAPVIAADRPPGRFTAVRRRERRAHAGLSAVVTDHLRLIDGDDSASAVAGLVTTLAAGTQVPIAAGAWMLVLLSHHRDQQDLLMREGGAEAVVWETLRLCPPTWMLPRVTSRATTLGDVDVPGYAAVAVSPLALGQDAQCAPGPAPLEVFDASRWLGGTQRPGAWLPFGAGARTCPGRNLALAQLSELSRTATGWDLEPTRPLGADTSRGLAPLSDPIVVSRPHGQADCTIAGTGHDAIA